MDKKVKILQYLATKGIIAPEKQQEEIAKLADACPVAVATEKGLTDEIDLAYESYLIATGNAAVDPKQKTGVPGTQPTPEVSAAEQLAISKTLASQQESRNNASKNASIDKLVLDKPAPSEYIAAGTVGKAKKESWAKLMGKIESGEYVVCDNDTEEVAAEKRIASADNFAQLKTLVESGADIPVRIADSLGKVIGYVVNKGATVGAANTNEQMTKAELFEYLVLDTAGYILATDTKPGVMLRLVHGKTDPTDPGKSTPDRHVVADKNKKEAITHGSYVVSREVTKEMKDATISSELAFRVKLFDPQTKKPVLDNNGNQKTKTIRASLTASLPVLTRKPEFIDKFGTGENQSNSAFTEDPTEKQLAAINKAQRSAIAALRAKCNNPEHIGSMMHLQDKLAAFDVKAEAAPAGTIM